jgi:signal transduction histidine kinase/ActR/RegA family two-component response regulator
MPTIDTLSQRAVAISPETLGGEVYARFRREPDCLVIAVVEGDRPVGLVERDTFLIEMGAEYGRALHAGRPIRGLMDAEPVVVEASMEINTFCDSMLAERASSLLRGFVIVENGRYLGVGTVLSLLQATSASSRARVDQMADTARSLDMAQAQTQVMAMAQAKTRFLGVMSHELRTPMNGVLAVAELLRRQPLGGDAQAYVQTIIDSSETLLGILNDALDLSRAESGEFVLKPRPALLNQMMDEIQTQWSPRAAQDGVNLLIGYDGDPDLAAEIDVARLKQVFNNLVGAALQYARNGVVEASLKAVPVKDTIRIEARVRDNGQRMPADSLDAAFEPFSEAARQGGAASGFGLAMCRQIVEQMGGRIWAEDNAGKGSTFGFELAAPRAEVARAEGDNVSDLPDLRLLSQPHILIVDDNATNRVVAQALCEMFGCTSECAEDGLEALEAIQHRGFDLVLMDIKMPRMDGVEATRAIRALPGAERHVPILALTANADHDDARHYLSVGMAAVVEKPIKPERLRQAMHVALANPAQALDSAVADGRIVAA